MGLSLETILGSAVNSFETERERPECMFQLSVTGINFGLENYALRL